MTTSPSKNLTFEEYLTYAQGTDNRYELINGSLVMVPLPTSDHSDVILQFRNGRQSEKVGNNDA
jgi:Uma2 family endonuclease